ncbi:helix-turn-helix domain-containing protein [Novosphingobium sp. HII-3]|uniref:helix-turn-helix domain-containing protein n=1 Tax=Novosphingobium sp. HII-3 TaxID=2075565 RepID=UPI000CDB0731|nr:helix-turn-helix domain-containing protein [Novosphingobium sp. HII-3]
MNRWFRFYTDAIRNPKVARLSDKDFRLWVELLSVASENGGSIPCLSDLKHLLKRRLDHLSTGVDRLISSGLIDALADGYEPHNWSKFQYKSDTSTGRVKKFRGKRNVSETPPDTEADTEQNTVDKSTEAAPSSDKEFWAASKSYLGKSKAGMIGKWVRDYGKERTASAITSAQIERAVDPVPYIERALRNSAQAKQAALRVPI